MMESARLSKRGGTARHADGHGRADAGRKRGHDNVGDRHERIDGSHRPVSTHGFTGDLRAHEPEQEPVRPDTMHIGRRDVDRHHTDVVAPDRRRQQHRQHRESTARILLAPVPPCSCCMKFSHLTPSSWLPAFGSIRQGLGGSRGDERAGYKQWSVISLRNSITSWTVQTMSPAIAPPPTCVSPQPHMLRSLNISIASLTIQIAMLMRLLIW